MNIAYSCDEAYISHTGISIISVCENNKHVPLIHFYLIAKDVSEYSVEIINDICSNYGRIFTLIPFSSIAYDLNISSIGRHIETIYSKVFFSRIAELNKVIYFDSDIIVNGDLLSLWNIELPDLYMGVVETFTVSKAKLGIPEGQPFFNDGFAIVNVDYCRKQNLISQVLDVISIYDGEPPVLSEGALNKVCKSQVKFLSPRYNMMSGLLYYCLKNLDFAASKLHYSKDDLNESSRNPVVIHYLSGFYNRPWFLPCSHPYKDKYFYYKSLSPWRGDELILNKLPYRLRLIKSCYDLLGCNLTSKIRTILKKY